MDDVRTAAAVDIARAIRERRVSPTEVVATHIARIEAVNPRLNAVVADRFEEALEEARRAERRVMREAPEDLPALLGVPFTVKELIAVEGMPHTAGVVARRHAIAERDAPLVARLRGAGAIPLGVTNVSEAGLWLESDNRIYGRTNNAYSRFHIAGGSSGGEAAIIGAGGSPLGIGADIGGSIRNPSFFNGVVGHKPSGGLVPSTGHWPPAEGERGRYCVSGPMGRRVRDLVHAMEILSPATDPHRDSGRPPFRRLPGLRPSEVTVYWYDTDGITPVAPEVSEALARAADGLARRGFRVERWRPPGLWAAPALWMSLVSASDRASVRELLGDGRPIALASQWGRWPFGRADHPLISLLMATFDGAVETSARRLAALRARRDSLRASIEERLGPRGVLLCLPYPRPAPRHGVPLSSPLAFAYCGVFNVLELPATAVPIGRSPHGLPIGAQVVGRRHADPLTLAVAEHLEDETGGWHPPPMP